MTDFERATSAAQRAATLGALRVGPGQIVVLAGGLLFM